MLGLRVRFIGSWPISFAETISMQRCLPYNRATYPVTFSFEVLTDERRSCLARKHPNHAVNRQLLDLAFFAPRCRVGNSRSHRRSAAIHRGACESQQHSTECTLPRAASARLSWNLRMGTWSLASYRCVAPPPLRPPWLFAGLRPNAWPAGVLECLW